MTSSLQWQLFDDQGRVLDGQGAGPGEVFAKTLLHGGAHVWIWREGDNGPELMLQRRSMLVKTFPGLLDISAAGHIDFGEQPLETAIREVKEEIGLTISANDLWHAGVFRTFLDVSSGHNAGKIENEFHFMYLLQLKEHVEITFEDGEVHSIIWKPVDQVKAELSSAAKKDYLPHPPAYFAMLFSALEDYKAASAHAARSQAA